MVNDLNRNMSSLALSKTRLNRFLAQQAVFRGLSEVVLFDSNGQVLGHTGFTMALETETVPQWALDKADSGEVAVLTSEYDDRVRALVRVDDITNTYLYVGQFVDPTVIGYMEETRSAARQYQAIEGKREGLQTTFALVFILVALLLLLTAIWIGVSIAQQLAQPIMALIDAAERVRSGDLSVRVPEQGGDDEIGSLVRAFNRMTGQIHSQQHELLETNRELDERRRFTETVLTGVSAGVIGLDPDGSINLPNRSASELLGKPMDRCIGKPLGAAVPAFAELFDDCRQRGKLVQGEVSVEVDDQHRAFLARIAPENLGEETLGYILTFDDITELQAAQTKAAWAGVARRIAHEIKNPLTPIQLSAERLKRKYLKQISDDTDTFEACTDTIIRQVGDIRRMVNEFSEFARMPAPEKSLNDIRELVKQGAFLQRQEHDGTAFTVDVPPEPVTMLCDPRQMGQVMTNLLKNAAEAIEGREEPDTGGSLPSGRVEVVVRDGESDLEIVITDNGRGFPKDRSRLTEPYMTTRKKGTGLGLAIVKKIVEDHGGTLILEDAEGGGARVALVFPKV